jgi:hypothetical protein
MANQWDQGRCNEKSGFLFSHACSRPPNVTCDVCQKPICGDHVHQAGADALCTSCVKKRQSRRGNQSGRSHRSHYDDHYYDDDPYFYGGYYYGHSYYGHNYHSTGHNHPTAHNDPNDFTEADAESLAAEHDDDFENDMSES